MYFLKIHTYYIYICFVRNCCVNMCISNAAFIETTPYKNFKNKKMYKFPCHFETSKSTYKYHRLKKEKYSNE